MPTTVGSHTVATFTSPTNGTSPIDANQVRGNDNTLRTSYVNHDADPGIHFQSSTLASRPVAGVAGRKWMTVDGSTVRYWYDTGSVWVEGTAVGLSSAQTIALTGDVTGSVSSDLSTGASITTSIAAGAIVNADVNASAAIAFSKLESLPSANLLVGNGSNVATATAVTGDVTITNAGVTAIAAGVIVNADINASAAIADTKLATISTAGKVSNSATTATSANTASAIVARDASGNFSAGTVTATTLAGTLSTAAQPNVTSVGTLSSLTISGDLTVDTNTLYVDAANNRVGIGTATPTVLLDVSGGTATAARFTATGSNAQIVATDGTVTQFVGYADTNVSYSGSQSNHAYAILTNNTERARIDTSGNLLVGANSNPGILNKSVVVDSGSSSLAGYVLQNNTTGRTSTDGGALYINGSLLNLMNFESDALTFGTSNAERARVKANGQVRFVPLASDPAGEEAGDVYYNSSTNKLRVYNGTAWVDLH